MPVVIDLWRPTASTQSGLQPETAGKCQRENLLIPEFAHQRFVPYLVL